MHVLLIDDDSRTREIVEQGLTSHGFVVTAAGDGLSGIELAQTLDVDLVLLDLILPGMGGLDVLRKIRLVKPRLPVIALTALDDTRSKIEGLDAGADDYVTKPFSIEELAARIRARLRRSGRDDAVLEAGPLRLDLATHRASLSGYEVPVSGRELALLATFARHPGQVLSRQRLRQTIWGPDFDSGSNIVEVYIAALRRKIPTGLIETIRGLGYRLVVPPDPLLDQDG